MKNGGSVIERKAPSRHFTNGSESIESGQLEYRKPRRLAAESKTMTSKTTLANDAKIRKLHLECLQLVKKLQANIDALKCAGPHSVDGSNALSNVRDHLAGLSRR